MAAGTDQPDDDGRHSRTSSVRVNSSKNDPVIWTRPSASPGTAYGTLLPLSLLSCYFSHRSFEDRAVLQALIISSLLFFWTLLEANKTTHWVFTYLQRRLVAFGLLVAYFYGDMDFSAALLVGVVAYLILMKEASSPPVAGNFSIGERSLTSQACALFLGGCMKNALIFAKSGRPQFFTRDDASRDLWEANTVIQVFGCAVFVTLALTRFIGRGRARKFIFICALVASVAFAWYTLEKRVLNQSLLAWFLRMTMGSPQKMSILTMWSALLAASVGFAIGSGFLKSGDSSSFSTVERKLFHVAISVVFILGARSDPVLLHLASSLMFWGFLVAESCRVLDIWPVSNILNSSFLPFLDEKDLSGPLTLTNIYLLVGCSLPVWLSSISSGYRPLTEVHPFTLLAGVLSVGVGDSAASIGGKWLGMRKWPDSMKSLEGSVCCAAAQLFVAILLPFLGVRMTVFDLLIVSASIFGSTIFEAVTDQVDNLVLPFASYIILVHL